MSESIDQSSAIGTAAAGDAGTWCEGLVVEGVGLDP